ncbi:hypothetical protein EK21DRAFT_15676, partial [Setomelanomma holmii]
HHETTIYQPLIAPNQIRVVHINQGYREDPVACKIHPFILIDGRQTRIRANLRDALLEIRLEDRPRIVWIDALSINQADTEERNHQVKIMRDIYKGAGQVIVWLGSAHGDSATAMDLLVHLADDLQCYHMFALLDWQRLTTLLSRSYWSRVWVHQEVFLARAF